MPHAPRPALDRTIVALQRLATWSHDCREALAISQLKASQGAGISQGGVSRIESGTCTAIPLVSYLALARYYADASAQAGITITTPGMLLLEPAQVGTVQLNPTRSALLHLLATATPPQQRLLLEIAQVLLRQHPLPHGEAMGGTLDPTVIAQVGP